MINDRENGIALQFTFKFKGALCASNEFMFVHYAVPFWVGYSKHKEETCSMANLELKINQINPYNQHYVK
jgi:hypothetical protein